jgi:hypothetical protein
VPNTSSRIVVRTIFFETNIMSVLVICGSPDIFVVRDIDSFIIVIVVERKLLAKPWFFSKS